MFIEVGQTAVGIPGGAEVVSHGLRVLWDRSNGKVGGSYDWSNAFNTMDRNLILSGLKLKVPELVPCFMASYGTPSLIFFISTPGAPPIIAEEGVAQGDTLGLFYYCVGQAIVTETTRDTLASEGITIDLVAYADNIFIPPTLSPAALWRTYSLLDSNMLTMARVPNNRQSSFILSRDPSAINEAASLFPIGFPACPDGFVALGNPIGVDQFVSQTVSARIEKIKQKLSAIKDYGDLQVALLLLRFAAGPFFISQLRGTSFCATSLYTRPLDDHVRSLIAELLEAPLNDFVWFQAGLEIDQSGLGLTPTSLTGPGAFIAAVARTVQSFHQVFAVTANNTRNFFMSLLKQGGAGKTSLTDDIKHASSLCKELTGGTPSISLNEALAYILKNPRSLQRALVQKMCTYRAAVFKSSLRDVYDTARILSCSDHDGNAYLRVIPYDPSLTINPWQMVESVLHRLGLPSHLCDWISGMRCPCKLKVSIDEFGHHLRACHLGNSEHIATHNGVVSLIASLARDCSFFVTVEPRRAFQTTRERPDLIIRRYHALSQRPAAIDVTLLAATAPSNVGSAAHGTGHLCLLRERLKEAKYGWQTGLTNMHFIGAACDDGGAIGPGFKSLIDHLCSRGADHASADFNWSAPNSSSLFYQKLSCHVQKGFTARAKLVSDLVRQHAAKSAQKMENGADKPLLSCTSDRKWSAAAISVISNEPPVPDDPPDPGAMHDQVLQTQLLGEQLYGMLSNRWPEVAGKLTGMLLECPRDRLLAALAVQSEIEVLITEARSALAEYDRILPPLEPFIAADNLSIIPSASPTSYNGCVSIGAAFFDEVGKLEALCDESQFSRQSIPARPHALSPTPGVCGGKAVDDKDPRIVVPVSGIEMSGVG